MVFDRSLGLGLLIGVLALAFQYPMAAQAFVATEIDYNIIELRSSQSAGLVVSEIATRRVRKTTWVYFCVREKGSQQGEPTRCFYGSSTNFDTLALQAELFAVEYGLKTRIKNDRSRIPIGSGAYFYPVYLVRRSP